MIVVRRCPHCCFEYTYPVNPLMQTVVDCHYCGSPFLIKKREDEVKR